jgi:hypothetical protein
MPEFYNPDDVQQILQIAIAQQSSSGELTRAQLLEIASDLGISASELASAEQEWLTVQGEVQERSAFRHYQQSKVKQHLTKYLIANIFLVLMDLLSGGGLGWSLYVLLGWGLLLALDTWKTLNAGSESYETAFQNWRRRRLMRRSVNTLMNRFFKGTAT